MIQRQKEVSRQPSMTPHQVQENRVPPLDEKTPSNWPRPVAQKEINQQEVLGRQPFHSLLTHALGQMLTGVPAGVPGQVALHLPENLALRNSKTPADTFASPFVIQELPWEYEVVKRVFDVLVTLILLLSAALPMLIIALAIKLDSSGPVFFRQVRIGRHGQPFSMYKFRSMYCDAESRLKNLLQHNQAQGPMFKIHDDPRITRVGKIIRRLSLDELPQLFNILDGSMSLVGPRPPLPNEVKHYEPWQLARLGAVPGMTGLWQVSRGSTISFDEMVALDLEYIKHWSLWLELKVLVLTLPAVLTSRGAY
jgi:exopolysaccharide biosynthesis polyprenyl glycosylphosphotransferase